MAERLEKPWLPENYQNFSIVSQQFDDMNKLRIAICAGVVVASYFLIPSEYRNPINGPIIGAVLGLLTEPSWSSLNVWGRKLYLERDRLARDISTKEKWPTSGVSSDQLVQRAKATLTLTNQFAPVQNGFKIKQTPSQRAEAFGEELNRINFSEPNPKNMLRSVARKALNIGEAYWEFVASEDTESMVEHIKRVRATLTTEQHFSF